MKNTNLMPNQRTAFEAVEGSWAFGSVWDKLGSEDRYLAMQVAGLFNHKAYFEQTDDVRAGLNKLDWSLFGEPMQIQLVSACYRLAESGLSVAKAIPTVKRGAKKA